MMQSFDYAHLLLGGFIMKLENLFVDANEILEDIEQIDISELQEELKSGTKQAKLTLCNLLNSVYTIKTVDEAINKIKSISEQNYINSNLKQYPDKPNVIKLSNWASTMILLSDKFNYSRTTKCISYIISPIVFIFLGSFAMAGFLDAELDEILIYIVFFYNWYARICAFGFKQCWL